MTNGEQNQNQQTENMDGITEDVRSSLAAICELGSQSQFFGADEALAKIGITHDQIEKHYAVAKKYIESHREKGEL